MDLIFYLIPGWCVAILIAYFIGSVRGDPASGAILGFLFGPLGWLLTLRISDKRRTCPLCAGILPNAQVVRCKHCGGELKSAPRSSLAGVDPMEQWEQREALKPGNLKPLVKKDPALRPPPSRDRRK